MFRQCQHKSGCQATASHEVVLVTPTAAPVDLCENHTILAAHEAGVNRSYYSTTMIRRQPPTTTTPEMLFQIHRDVCAYAFMVFLERNRSYSTGEDGLLNIRRHGVHGVEVRMDDKNQRVHNWLRSGVRWPTGTEGAVNTFVDRVNYSILELALIFESQPEILLELRAALGDALKEGADCA